MRLKRLLHLLLNGTGNPSADTRRCPRCGGKLEPNVGGPGDSVIFAASPPEELCIRCLTGQQ